MSIGNPFAPSVFPLFLDGDLCATVIPAEAGIQRVLTPLTLSLSKGWFDKLTMSGYAKVSTRGEGTQAGPLGR